MKRILVAVLLLTPIWAKTQSAPTSDPQALTLAAQAFVALTNSTAVNDVTLTGTAAWTAGSDIESGSVTLQAKGTTESRMDLSLSGGRRSEIRNGAGTGPQGTWIGSDGLSHAYALHNCRTDAVWFFPALASMFTSDPSVLLSYVGAETRGGSSVQHIRSYRYVNADTATAADFQTLSTVDFYLDANSLLLVSITFNIHPDSDSGTSIPVNIAFGNYQVVSGMQVPLHVQKYIQGNLTLDLSVTGLTLNSGIPDSTFNVQ